MRIRCYQLFCAKVTKYGKDFLTKILSSLFLTDSNSLKNPNTIIFKPKISKTLNIDKNHCFILPAYTPIIQSSNFVSSDYNLHSFFLLYESICCVHSFQLPQP